VDHRWFYGGSTLDKGRLEMGIVAFFPEIRHTSKISSLDSGFHCLFSMCSNGDKGAFPLCRLVVIKAIHGIT
jgi:hypothetical protein